MASIVGPDFGLVTGHVVLDEGDKSSLSVCIMQDTIAEIAAELGTKPEALKKWRQRGVPHRMRLPILLAARERGIDIPPEAFDAPATCGCDSDEERSVGSATTSEAA